MSIVMREALERGAGGDVKADTTFWTFPSRCEKLTMLQILHPDDEKHGEPKLSLYEPNPNSSHYPWGVTKEGQSKSISEPEEPDAGEVTPSVEATFAAKFRITEFKPHHYFDYIAGTSTGG